MLDHIVKLTALRRLYVHGRIAPDQAKIAVLGQDLLHLGLDLAFKAAGIILFTVLREIPVVGPAHHAAVGVAEGVSAAVRLVPVQLFRIIQSELESVARTGIGQLFNDVALKRRAVHHVVIIPFGMKQAETVVMF